MFQNETEIVSRWQACVLERLSPMTGHRTGDRTVLISSMASIDIDVSLHDDTSRLNMVLPWRVPSVLDGKLGFWDVHVRWYFLLAGCTGISRPEHRSFDVDT